MQYKARRDFSKTSEPAGGPSSNRMPGNVPFFVVQKHAARRLHFDFRLEMDGVLKSWAVPKGLPTVKGQKRLAVHVEDHPIEYADFEGIIPEGSYGAGTVMVWDRGTYRVRDDDPLSALEEGKIHLELSGQKLKGEWTMVRLRRSADPNEWLVLKTGSDAPPISPRRQDQSVLTKRSLKQIETAADAHWHSHKTARNASPRSSDLPRTRARHPKAAAKRTKTAAKTQGQEPTGSPARAKETGPEQAALEHLPRMEPKFIAPMKCLFVKRLLKGADLLYEIKFDGYRALAIKDGTKVSLISRNQKDLTRNYSTVAEGLLELDCTEVVLDGEIVALDQGGRPSFQMLQRYESGGRPRTPLVYYAFDLLQLNGRDLRGLPLVHRKQLLTDAVSGASESIRYSSGLEGDVDVIAREMETRGLEGLIAKKRHSKYESGKRTGAWTKFKWTFEQEFVIGGYTSPAGSRNYFGAVLVGYYEGRRLLFCSKVGTGFDEALLRSVYDRFQTLRRPDPPFVDLPEKRSRRYGQGLTVREMKRCSWIEPTLVCQVRFSEWTQDHHLRHPVFLGLRQDKNPLEVVKEEARTGQSLHAG